MVEQGFSGDGGPAIQAMIKDPWSVAVDKAGNKYIADTDNHRVRKVDTNGIITTIAGMVSGIPVETEVRLSKQVSEVRLP